LTQLADRCMLIDREGVKCMDMAEVVCIDVAEVVCIDSL